jgi:membrane-bound inhibitor of C-type lysozyme/uncharacterized membrane protein
MPYRYCLIFFLFLAACSSGQAQREKSADTADFHPDERPLATTLVYDCNGFDFIARVGPGEIALWLPDQYLILSQVRSASGTLYEEGDISFWSKGEEAMLTLGADIHQNCQLQPSRVPWEDARRRGVDFRAIGNEPGWYIEIQSGRQLLFVYDFGMQRLLVPDPGPQITGNKRVHESVSGSQMFRVEIVDETCVDTMSDERFPEQVTIIHGNTHYQGCGQSLDYPWEALGQ